MKCYITALFIISVIILLKYVQCSGCGADWTFFNVTCMCYIYKYTNTKNKIEAVKGCKALGSDLVLARSLDEFSFLQSLRNNHGGNNQHKASLNFGFWINLMRSTKDKIIWVDGNGIAVTWGTWQQTTPDNVFCTLQGGSGWYPQICSNLRPFMCVKPHPQYCGEGTWKGSCKCDYCLPNQCEEGTCLSMKSKNFAEGVFNYTCVCNDGYGGPKCELNDNPCKNDPKAKCKNNGTCVPKVQPGDNDWLCQCPGKPKLGQNKDCSEEISYDTLVYERQKKIVIALVAVPTSFIVVAWVIFCILECIEIGKLPDLEFSDSITTTPTTSSISIEERRTKPNSEGENIKLNKAGSNGRRKTVTKIVRDQAKSQRDSLRYKRNALMFDNLNDDTKKITKNNYKKKKKDLSRSAREDIERTYLRHKRHGLVFRKLEDANKKQLDDHHEKQKDSKEDKNSEKNIINGRDINKHDENDALRKSESRSIKSDAKSHSLASHSLSSMNDSMKNGNDYRYKRHILLYHKLDTDQKSKDAGNQSASIEAIAKSGDIPMIREERDDEAGKYTGHVLLHRKLNVDHDGAKSINQ